MEVILLEKIQNLGNLGAKVFVKPGYARNYLIPTGKAVPVTPQNLAAFEARRAELEAKEARSLATAEARTSALAGLGVVVIRQRAGSEGKLFGSVGTGDIAAAVIAAGVEVHRSEVRLPEGPLRMVGDYQVQLHLHPEVETRVTISIVPEE